ncbi:MAG TPA: glycosyltransferase family 4 protein [Candidatus Acidoferrales bacterium]|nr:glycosyltransferase family 4 protein [Candidatus Acidoferrales bacterium]
MEFGHVQTLDEKPGFFIMADKKLRALLLCTHPTQYGSPMWRLMAQRPELEILVAYCSLEGAEAHVDPDFGVQVAWDIPLLDNYPWVKLRNISPRPVVGKFFGLINPGVWRLIRAGKFDAVVMFTGYICATFWIALAAAKLSRVPILFGTDAHDISPRDDRAWKTKIKKYLWPRLFRLADVVIAPSSGTVSLMRSLGIPPDRVMLMPYVVHNEWWIDQAARVDRAAVRRDWNIPAEAPVALFCAKLQPWKRPQDLLRAFASANVPGSYLVYAGDGPMRNELEAQAKTLGVFAQTRFLGFVNQSGLPRVYCGSDLLVLPSEYEPFGVVVNEMMLCGHGAIVSDRVGAKFDLISQYETGFVYPFEDVDALTNLLRRTLSDREALRRYGEAAERRIAEWSPRAYIDSFVHGIERAIDLRKSPPSEA